MLKMPARDKLKGEKAMEVLHDERANARRKRRWIITLLLVLAIFIVLLFLTSVYQERYYCTFCGASQLVSDYQIPFVDVTYFRHITVHETSFSRAMQAHQFIGQHQHRWKFGHGRGNTVACALAPKGQRTVYYRISNKYLGIFIGMLADYRGRDVARRWCSSILDDKIDRQLDPERIMLSIPARVSREEFDKLVSDPAAAHALFLDEIKAR
jgi:predicted nucleic acid-binding Zn ribbon protein